MILSTSPQPAIRFTRVAKRHGGRDVLRGVTLDVRAGELLGLVGVNGAGKTTLLRCLLDFCAADEGEIALFGIDSRESRARAPLAFLPERFEPPPFLTGEEFLAYVLQLQGQRYDERRALDTLAALDLAPSALPQRVREYSKGMTQKLGLAAALIADKQLYVLDEPCSGLDPKAHALFNNRMRHLREQGRTVLLTSHALADIDALCDRLAILHDGSLQFVGTPDACRRHYGAATLEQAFMASIQCSQ
ncbi:ATP-binding cassette domain-containing protein [Duganella sp. FT92W]|uniref:ATP-binding cassette domain-containing protein n=1 Tax=Pseudoduganella rivuli TaxID=2666085 RepID=A0A7X2LS40_9BURK|nr:ABC transporter ATP-binding protein [Pseudoduganella rivuli]MRV71478.1 ATP-binding cassette domain-containing protein [Pseudoduganella rivuli]